jgi:hypothetical protein
MKKFLTILLFVIFYGAYMLFTQLIFGENNLIPIKGKLWQKYNFVKVEALDQKERQYAYLTFYLKGDPHQYTLKADIENVQQGNQVFAGVDQSIDRAAELEVWIRKGDLANLNLRVYKISADGAQVFNIPIKPASNGLLCTYILCLSILFLLVYYLLKKHDHKVEILTFSMQKQSDPLFI